MRCIIVLLSILHVKIFVADGTVNYCGAKMCAHTDVHTFCRYPPGPSHSCVGFMDARLSAEEKARVLGRLNRRRSEAASGIRNQNLAGDMLKLRWVEELARMAQRWADQCRPPTSPEEHDACRDLYSTSVGQTVASVVGEAPGLRPETMVDMWYMQSIMYRGNASLYIPPESNNNFYGDFAQIVWSKTYMVGCGRSRFMIPWRGRLRSVERLVCNFAPRGPVPWRPLWSEGEPGSACPSRSQPDADLPALCTYQYDMLDVIDLNSDMSLEETLLLNTIMEIARNVSLDYTGSLDELYLTKIAVASIVNPDSTESLYNSVKKRFIMHDAVSEIEDNHLIYEGKSKVESNNVTVNKKPILEAVQISERKLIRKKTMLIGRPKSYDIEDLNDLDNLQKLEHKCRTPETTTRERDLYVDYAYVNTQDEDISPSIISTITMVTYSSKDTTVKEVGDLNYSMTETPTILSNTSEEAIDILLSDVISNLTALHSSNESLDGNVVDDYLSDPETARQLQEALDRMENNLAVPTSTVGKIRRELKDQDKNEQQTDSFRRKERNSANDIKAKDKENQNHVDKGPMLNMVFKYMPYLKPYEKSLLGDSSSSNDSCKINKYWLLHPFMLSVIYFFVI